MRVITEWFSVENEQFVFEGTPNESMPARAKDAITACREWLGMHEGEARIALSAQPPPLRRPVYGMSHLRILFSTALMKPRTSASSLWYFHWRLP